MLLDCMQQTPTPSGAGAQAPVYNAPDQQGSQKHDCRLVMNQGRPCTMVTLVLSSGGFTRHVYMR